MNKRNYQITIGYKAVFTVDIKAESEAHAKQMALETLANGITKLCQKNINLQDDNYGAHGCVDMDSTWNMYSNNN